MTDTLQIERLQAGYGDIQVLWDVTLSVPGKGISVLIGSNGAGKTTLLKTVTGLVPASAGTINWCGTDLTTASAAQILNSGIAHVPEGRRLFGPMSVEENLMMGAFARTDGRAEVQKTLRWVYDIFPRLAERRKQAAGTLSGGEQQMCAIGRGMMSTPRLLIIDELSLGLSPILVEQLSEDLQQLASSGVAIFLVEQDVAAALAIAQTAFVMDRGVIIKQGPSKDIAEDPAVLEAYMGGL
jgi:branched-chain amino acid transport system ATP-binding protein